MKGKERESRMNANRIIYTRKRAREGGTPSVAILEHPLVVWVSGRFIYTWREGILLHELVKSRGTWNARGAPKWGSHACVFTFGFRWI